MMNKDNKHGLVNSYHLCGRSVPCSWVYFCQWQVCHYRCKCVLLTSERERLWPRLKPPLDVLVVEFVSLAWAAKSLVDRARFLFPCRRPSTVKDDCSAQAIFLGDISDLFPVSSPHTPLEFNLSKVEASLSLGGRTWPSSSLSSRQCK